MDVDHVNAGAARRVRTLAFIVVAALAALCLALLPTQRAHAASVLAVTTTTLPLAVVGTAYSQTLVATGGTGPYAWTVSAGTLPSGLSLSPDGNISGTPNTRGAASVTFTVTDSVSATASASVSMPVTSTAIADFAGSDRFATAVAVSQAEFPTTHAAGAVVLARADDYPDALVGAPLAAAKDAPLLFSSGTTLPAETLAEIQRVLAPGGLVIILGGDSAVPASIAAQVNALGYAQVRYSGADRYATAVSVADALGDPKTVFLATGTNFPDALTAGPAATKTGDAILLTDGSALPATTSAYLAAHTGQQDYAVGGPAAAAYPSATPLVGADRYATALAVLGQFYSSPQTMGLASGASFADALAGGAFMSHVGGPLLLSDPNSLPSSVRTYLTENAPPLVSLSIFGGTSAVSSSVQTAVGVALGQ